LKVKVRQLVEKSDAMKQHEKWIEDTVKRKPKHPKEGLPIEPWHALIFLGVLLVIMIIIGALLHR